MTLTRCVNGHFYDKDKFYQCPHCDSAGLNTGSSFTFMQSGNMAAEQIGALPNNQNKQMETPSVSSLEDAVKDAYISAVAPVSYDEGATVSYYNRAIGAEPVVGWLVCIEGRHLGEDFRLKSGRNSIGRANSMDVALIGDNTVSRERHATVIYDPVNCRFLVLPGDARELCYLNDELVLSAVELAANGVLKVGATKLMFIPCCTDAFNWDIVMESV